MEDFLAVADEFEDFEVVGGAAYDGRVTDTMVVYRANGMYWFAGFKDGCVVSGPHGLDYALSGDDEPTSAPSQLPEPKAKVGA